NPAADDADLRLEVPGSIGREEVDAPAHASLYPTTNLDLPPRRRISNSPFASFRRVAPPIPVSVIVPTRNEERNLPGCLASLARLDEIADAVARGDRDGYYVALQMFFLGRSLRHGDNRLWKLSLFRRGAGRFECRLSDQDASMADMEIHEHVVVQGTTAKLAS